MYIEEKGRSADLVTQADRASEATIVRLLRHAFPHAVILGEEGGVREGTSCERWIVDPLDGTMNYAHAYPLFCISIAYERGRFDRLDLYLKLDAARRSAPMRRQRALS